MGPADEALKDQYYIVAIDNLGHGESEPRPATTRSRTSPPTVTAVADADELERFHYCGLSVGGITGVQYRRQHPANACCR